MITTPHRSAVLLPLLLALGACAGSGAAVVPSGEASAAKPRDCALEFLYKAPDRPYDELGEVTEHTTTTTPEAAREALRPRACELGADALILTRHVVTNAYGHELVSGIAIKYTEPVREAPAEAKPEAKPEPVPGPVNL
jgi:hypothetical protein